MHSPSTSSLLVSLGLAGLLLLAPGRAAEPAAQLIAHTLDKTNPTATFTIRFARPMVDAASVGKVAEPAPVELQPAAKGKFTWLSTRSGVWAPDEPLSLSSTFRFVFRAGAKDAGGAALEGEIAPTFQTPGLTMKGWHSPRYFNREDALAQPDFNLLFNADINAAEAGPFLTFSNKGGKKIAANVVQADPLHHPLHRFASYRSEDRSLLTWKARFFEKITPSIGGRAPEVARQNQLFVTPSEPLSVGEDWKLTIAEGLPSTEAGVNLLAAVEIPIGTVREFLTRTVEAVNNGHGGRKLVVRFTKLLAESVTAASVPQWIKISPAPKGLVPIVEGAQVTFTGEFKLDTEYTVTVARGLPAADPFTLQAENVQTTSFEPIAPSLVLEGFATDRKSVV